MPDSSCVVMVPVAQRIEPPVDDALRELERRGYTVWRSFGHSAIDYARSKLATQALRQGFEQTLWVDSDILFQPDEVDRLLAVTSGELPAAEVQPLVVASDTGRRYLCEDFAFCERVRACGISIWADTRMRLYHIGTYGFSWEDAGKDQERFGTYNFTVKHT